MAQLIHARSLYIGTSAERTATTPPADAAGLGWWDTDQETMYFWSGTAWEAGSGIGGQTPPALKIWISRNFR
jgi:hypothetical protein